MLNQLDNFYFSLPEPQQSAFLYLRKHLLAYHPQITEHFKFLTAFFVYKGKNICYFSVRKKDNQAYIGFIKGYLMKHKALVAEGRSQVKVYYFDGAKDIDIATINQLLEKAIRTIDKD